MRSSFKLLQNDNFKLHVERLGFESDCLMMAVGLIGSGCEFIAHSVHKDSGKFWAYVALLLSAMLFVWAKENLQGRGGDVIWRLFQVGITAGMLEILVDWALIDWVTHGQLFYKSTSNFNGTAIINDVVLLGSPIWMPMAWACLITVMGYFAIRLYKLLQPKLGSRPAAILVSVLIGIQAGISVGINEWLAAGADWWFYGPAVFTYPWWGTVRVPTCIPIGEAIQFSLLLPIAALALTRDKTKPLEGAMMGGGLFALAIAFGYSLAYLVLEYGRPLPSG